MMCDGGGGVGDMTAKKVEEKLTETPMQAKIEKLEICKKKKKIFFFILFYIFFVNCFIKKRGELKN